MNLNLQWALLLYYVKISYNVKAFRPWRNAEDPALAGSRSRRQNNCHSDPELACPELAEWAEGEESMQSFLISSKNREEAFKKAASLCSKNKIDKIDIDVIDFEKIIGIEDVRIIQKKIYLKPIKSETKAIILVSYNGLTIEAQNAFLKILEEPPNNTIIILMVSALEQILPTILSRCKVILIKRGQEDLTKKELDEIIELLSSLSSFGAGEKLKLAQDFGKSREKAIAWLEKMIVILRKNIIEEINKDSGFEQKKIKILQKIQDTYTIIKTTNVNQRFALENLFLSL